MTNRPANTQGERGEHRRRRHPGLEQEREIERAASGKCQRMDAVVQIEEIDGVVAKEGHDQQDGLIRGRPATCSAKARM